MKTSRPPPALHPAVTALDHARVALATERARFSPPAWGRHVEPASIARAKELVRERTTDKARERGVVIGGLLGFSGPLIPAYGALPDPFMKAMQWIFPTLIDHAMMYRVPGTRGRFGVKSLVLMSEPYIPDEDVLKAFAAWRPKLANLDLAVRHLPRAWLIHAPDNPTSQLFILGSSSLVR